MTYLKHTGLHRFTFPLERSIELRRPVVGLQLCQRATAAEDVFQVRQHLGCFRVAQLAHRL